MHDGNEISVSTSLKRNSVLDALRVLAVDFGRLFATECVCHLRTERDYWPSRFSTSSNGSKWRLTRDNERWEHTMHGDGIRIEPAPVRSHADLESAPNFYDRSGEPIVNSVGQALILAQGWNDQHTVHLRGQGRIRAAETIERANMSTVEGLACLVPILWPGQALMIGDFCWPDIVTRVAEIAKRSTLKPNEWHVTAGQQSYSLSLWRRRAEHEFGVAMVAPEIAQCIGDEPEHVWAVRSAFLRDSELAAQWLIERLAEPVQKTALHSEHALECSLNTEGRILVWAGKRYPLTRNMFDVVKVLYDAWEKGRPEVAMQSIRNAVDASALDESLEKVFKRRQNQKKFTDPVWHLIESVGQSVYRLRDPQKTQNPP